MASNAFLGLRSTDDFVTDGRPKHWRAGILRLYPNGSAPLTALTAAMRSESVDDPEFNWWTKTLPTQRASVTGVYTNSDLSSAYASGGVAGDNLFVKMSADDLKHFRVGHMVLLRDASNHDVDVVARVTGTFSNGASSFITASLWENDDNSTSNDLSDCDTALIMGNANEEGSDIPDAVDYNPVKIYNYTQIWRNSLDLTRTAMKTRLRYGDAYQEAKRQCLELHSIEIEKSLLWSVRRETTGPQGKPLRTTMGLIPMIKTYNSSNVFNYETDSDYSGQAWTSGGEEWLDNKLEVVARYADFGDFMCFAGSGALLGINRLAKKNGNYQLMEGATIYGIEVTKFRTPFGIINLLTHPLFSYEETNRNMLLLFQPKQFRWRHITDTMFKKSTQMTSGGYTSIDGKKEEFLTEAGMEWGLSEMTAIFNGVNIDNAG